MVNDSSAVTPEKIVFEEDSPMLFALLFCMAFNADAGPYANLSLQARNTIQGTVRNSNLRPIGDVRVTLQNNSYSPIASAFTDASGQFRFGNLPPGIYYVEIEPGVQDYERQSQRVEAVSRRAGTGEIFRIDITLKVKKNDDGTNLIVPANKSVVFYQPVPNEAKKEYASAVKSLEKNEFNAASSSLNRAIELFPDYYDALELLGTESVKRKQYESAIPHLAHAVEVNKDGWRAFYSLGVAQYETNQWSDAVKTFQRAVELSPDSANSHMMLGMALATNGETRAEAIQALEKAVSLGRDKIPQACFYLGALYAKNHQYREAANSLEEYLRLSPKATERDKIKKLIKEFREKANALKSQPE